MNMQMNMNQQIQGQGINQMSYYNPSIMPQKIPPQQIHNTDNILFVADLPEETCEEDLSNFFKMYKYSFSKVYQ